MIVIDNASTDGSINYIQEYFPQVHLVRNQENLGYAGANNVGFSHASGEYIVVLNPDTEADYNWLFELIVPFLHHPEIGLATPKILLMDRPQLINTCGNEITVTGLTYCRGLEESSALYSEKTYISAVSGAAFVIKRSVLERIGGFDNNFFIYYEETDLSLRALLAGYKCLYVPTSIIYHKYEFRFSPKKCFYQERNRYYSLLKTFKWPTLFVLIPGFATSEILSWGYSIIKGREHISSKIQSIIWLCKHRKEVSESRHRTQALRKVDDRDIISYLGYKQVFQQTTSPFISKVLATVINPFTYILLQSTRFLIRW